MLQDLGAGEVLGSGVKALQSYDTVRKQVMDVDEKAKVIMTELQNKSRKKGSLPINAS